MFYDDDDELWQDDRGDSYDGAAGLAVLIMALTALATFRVGRNILPCLWNGLRRLAAWAFPFLKTQAQRFVRWLSPRLRVLALKIVQGVCTLLARLRRIPTAPKA